MNGLETCKQNKIQNCLFSYTNILIKCSLYLNVLMSFVLLMIRVLYLVGEKIVCVIRIKSDLQLLQWLGYAPLRLALQTNCWSKKVPLLILITQYTIFISKIRRTKEKINRSFKCCTTLQNR
jgi:hypothetical protein